MPATPVAHHHLPSLPRDEEGPVFNEPWEAQAFALAVRLSETGRFSWREWTTALSQEIQAALGGSRLPDGTGSQESRSASGTYYLHWLSALERLCTEKGLVSSTDLQRRKEAWRQSYLHTPHGQPVQLYDAH